MEKNGNIVKLVIIFKFNNRDNITSCAIIIFIIDITYYFQNFDTKPKN